MERKNDLGKFMNLRHLRRLILERLVKVRKSGFYDGSLEIIDGRKILEIRRYLLDNARLTNIDLDGDEEYDFARFIDDKYVYLCNLAK